MAITEIPRPGVVLGKDLPNPPSSQKLELPISAERLRFIAEGRGIDLPHRFGLNPYKDYEVHCFEQKAEQAAKAGEHCLLVGPLLNDLILPNDDFIGSDREFTGISRWDFFKLVGDRLEEVAEVKTAGEFMNEYGAKMDEETGFPKLLGEIMWDFSRRIKKVIPSIYIPSHILVDRSRVRFRFISPTSQEGRTAFKRKRTPHEVIEPTPEIAEALSRLSSRIAA